MVIPHLLTVRQFAQQHPAFPEGGLRHRIFYSETNGLKQSGALVRNGRRILINEEKFFDWLEEQNGRHEPLEKRNGPPLPRSKWQVQGGTNGRSCD